jgi:hypothetical protein
MKLPNLKTTWQALNGSKLVEFDVWLAQETVQYADDMPIRCDSKTLC